MDTRVLTRSEPRAAMHPGAKTANVRDRGVRSQVVALGAALLVSACVLVTGKNAPLPALGWAAAFIFLAVERDVRESRIPNWLNFPAFGLALAYAALTGGAAGTAAALCGAALAFALLGLPYVCGWFGAGDVKAMMVLGALWGVGVLIPVLTWAIALGGVLALVWVTVRGGLPTLIARWWVSLVLTLTNRRWTYLSPAAGSAAAGGIPFAVTIGLGVATYQLWGTPWS